MVRVGTKGVPSGLVVPPGIKRVGSFVLVGATNRDQTRVFNLVPIGGSNATGNKRPLHYPRARLAVGLGTKALVQGPTTAEINVGIKGYSVVVSRNCTTCLKMSVSFFFHCRFIMCAQPFENESFKSA